MHKAPPAGEQPAPTAASQPAQVATESHAKPPAAMTNGEWTTHTTAEGREYFYNKALNKTQWDKPDELKTPEQ